MTIAITTATDHLSPKEIEAINIAAIFTPGRRSSASHALNEEEEGAGNEWGLPLLWSGEPGTGKTTALEQLAKRCGLRPVTISLAQCQAEDIGGFPVPAKDRRSMTKLPDSWVSTVAGAPRSLLVIDEFSVDPDKQAAALKLFSERMAGEIRLPAGCRLMAARNPEWCAATPNTLSAPNANRFGHGEWVAWGAEELGDFLCGLTASDEGETIDPVAHEAAVLEAWPEALAEASALVAQYLRVFPAHVLCQPLGSYQDPKRGEADQLRWPSPRIWEMVTRALASGIVHRLSKREKDAFCAMFLPNGVASAFARFRDEQDMAPPSEYLDGTAPLKLTKKVDRTWAIMQSTSAFVADPDCPKRLERAKAWWALAAKVIGHPNGGACMLVGPAKRLASKDGAGLGSDAIPEAGPVIDALLPVLKAAVRTRSSLT